MPEETTPKKKPRGKPFTGANDPRRMNGRAKAGLTLADKFRNALAEVRSEKQPDYTKLDALIDKVISMALEGDLNALEYALARGWGKLIDRIETNNINKNYDFSNLSLEEREKLLELIKRAKPTVPDDNPDAL